MDGDEGRTARSRVAGPRGGRERERTSASSRIDCLAFVQAPPAGANRSLQSARTGRVRRRVCVDDALMSKLDRVESPACWSVRHIPRHLDHGTRKHAVMRRKLLERSAAEQLLLSLSIGKAPATRTSRAELLVRGESARSRDAGAAAGTPSAVADRSDPAITVCPGRGRTNAPQDPAALNRCLLSRR
jgi:hypothetical protein